MTDSAMMDYEQKDLAAFPVLIHQFLKILKIYWAISLASALEIFSELSKEQEPIIPKEEEILL